MRVTYRFPTPLGDIKRRSYDMVSTYDHPYWVQGQGWTAAAALEDFDNIERNGTPRLQLADASEVEYLWGGPGNLSDGPGGRGIDPRHGKGGLWRPMGLGK